MSNPLLTIIIPVYNSEKYLKGCVESIINQRFTDYELILVNDGSLDNSPKICDELANSDSRIRTVHKNNGGASSARNYGLKLSKGKWILFIDSDDRITNDYLCNLINPIRRIKDLQFVHAGCSNFSQGKVVSIEQKYGYFVGSDPKYLLNQFRGLVVSKLYLNSIIRVNNITFDEHIRIAEDMAFTLDYLRFVNKYAFVEECGYLYNRDNETSVTHNVYSSFDKEYCAFIHIYKSLKAYSEHWELNNEDYIMRLEQSANRLKGAVYSLYRETHSRAERIIILESKVKIFGFLFKYLKYKERMIFNLMQLNITLFDLFLYQYLKMHS